MANEFAESKCDAGMWINPNLQGKHRDFLLGLAKKLFKGKKYLVTRNKEGMTLIKGWRKTEKMEKNNER